METFWNVFWLLLWEWKVFDQEMSFLAIPNWITGQIFIQTTCILNHKFIKFVKFRESRTIEISSFIVKLDPGNSVIKTLLLFCKIVTHNLTRWCDKSPWYVKEQFFMSMREVMMICSYIYHRYDSNLKIFSLMINN